MSANKKTGPQKANTVPATQKAPDAKKAQDARAIDLGPYAKGFWRQRWLPTAILMFLPFVLYFQSTSFGYVLDDKIVLSENKFVQKGTKGIKDIFGKESFTGFLGEQQNLVVGARYRPLSIATFALEHQYFGAKPRPEPRHQHPAVRAHRVADLPFVFPIGAAAQGSALVFYRAIYRGVALCAASRAY